MEDFNQGQPTIQAQGYNAHNAKGNGLEVTQLCEYHLKSSAKWIKIIAILSTIMMVLMIVAGFWMISKGYPLTATGIAYLVVSLIYVYPLIKAFGVSKHVNNAIYATDSQELETGMNDLRGLLTYAGVLAIIGFVFFVIGVIGVIVAVNKGGAFAEELLY